MAGDQVDLEQIPASLENFKGQLDLITVELEAQLKALGN